MKLKQSLPYYLLKTARPRQWVKNLALYAALAFSGFFFYWPADANWPYVAIVTFAFLLFCLLTSAVYIINDIIDYKADQQHPFKKKRPIASGNLPIPVAIFSAISLLLCVFFFSFWLTPFFRLLVIAYLALQLFYSFKLKNIAILDVVSIATGFLIRVYAGAVVVNLHMSVWFLLTVVSASLFLAVGKRQSERTLLSARKDSELGTSRVTLLRYSQRLLDQYTGMFANATWLTYALFTFQSGSIVPEGKFVDLFTVLPKTLRSEKLLMLSVPFVIVGVMRYLQLVYEDNQGESPDKVLFRDKPLLTTVFLFGLVVMLVIYVI
jgi:decaprenyl-phosphate phosphoribosyltransferase